MNNTTNKGGLRKELVNEMAAMRNKGVRLFSRVNEAQKSLPREISDKIAMEVFGMPFDQFYRQTGFWVGPETYAKLQLYFKRVKEAEENMNVVESIVRKILKEDVDSFEDNVENDNQEEEEYNPWLNGDACYMDGKYDIPYGYHVEINSGLGYVAIDNPNNPDESYFLQGDEADDLIKQISKYWVDTDCDKIVAINTIISGLF